MVGSNPRSVRGPRRPPRRDAAPGGARPPTPGEAPSPGPPRGRHRCRRRHAPHQRGVVGPLEPDSPRRLRSRASVQRRRSPRAAIGARRAPRSSRPLPRRRAPGRPGAPPPPRRAPRHGPSVSPASCSDRPAPVDHRDPSRCRATFRDSGWAACSPRRSSFCSWRARSRRPPHPLRGASRRAAPGSSEGAARRSSAQRRRRAPSATASARCPGVVGAASSSALIVLAGCSRRAPPGRPSAMRSPRLESSPSVGERRAAPSAGLGRGGFVGGVRRSGVRSALPAQRTPPRRLPAS